MSAGWTTLELDIVDALIRAAIWANQTEGRDVWFNVAVSRLYKDGDQWKDTAAFRRDDLPIVAKVVDMAYDWGDDLPDCGPHDGTPCLETTNGDGSQVADDPALLSDSRLVRVIDVKAPRKEPSS